MKKHIVIAFLCLSISSVPVSYAASAPESHDDNVALFSPSGSELLQKCGDYGKYKGGEMVTLKEMMQVGRNVGTCEGYIAGFNDGTVSATVDTPKNKRFCVPSGVDMDQMIRVVRKWLEDNPSVLHLPGNFLVEKALHDAFPCK